MVLFDSVSIRKEALEYAIELAKRTDSSLIILALLAGSSRGTNSSDDPDTGIRQTLRGVMETIRRAGLEADAELRTGNPSSELMKFLADCRSPKAIVWGGTSGTGGGKWRRDHWFGRVKDRLGCPVVVPARKT